MRTASVVSNYGIDLGCKELLVLSLIRLISCSFSRTINHSGIIDIVLTESRIELLDYKKSILRFPYEYIQASPDFISMAVRPTLLALLKPLNTSLSR